MTDVLHSCQRSEVALADRHSDKAKDNKEKLEQFVKDIK